MSEYPALVAGVLCLIGGTIGFARKRSLPSLLAGVSVGALYIWSGLSLRDGTPNGLEGALGASVVLLLSSLPRIASGPVPALLTVTSGLSTVYYGRIYSGQA